VLDQLRLRGELILFYCMGVDKWTMLGIYLIIVVWDNRGTLIRGTANERTRMQQVQRSG
jgi:hypothetical protein